MDTALQHQLHVQPTLLLVDDDRSLLTFLSLALAEHGVRVETAETGEEALRFLASHSGSTVVLLDCLMPRMDAPEFLSFLRTELPAVYERCHIYAFSSLNPLSSVRKEIDPWVKGFIDKPDDLFDLVGVIQDLLGTYEAVPSPS